MPNENRKEVHYPTALNKEQIDRLRSLIQTIDDHLPLGKDSVDLPTAHIIEALLRAANITVISSIRKLIEPQHDAPSMPNDTHGAFSR
jgi:hypothetical protein